MHTHEPSNWLKLIALLLVFFMTTGAVASAQTRHPMGLKLESSDAAVLTADDAQETKTVRQSDSLWNGALIGAGVAVAAGLFLCTRTEPWENCRDDVGPMLRIAAIGAGIGAGIDALIRKRVTISAPGSTALHAAPIIAPGTGGMQFALTF